MSEETMEQEATQEVENTQPETTAPERELSAEEAWFASSQEPLTNNTEQPEEEAKAPSTEEDKEDPEGSNTNETKSEDQEGTAKGEGVATKPEETASKDKWSAEDLEYLKAKGWEIDRNDQAEKILNSYKEAEKRITDSSKTISTNNARMAHIAHMIQTGDVGSIQELAKTMGTELPIDTRTPDDKVKEYEDTYNGVYESFNPVIEQLAQQAQRLKGSGESLSAQDVSNFLNETVQAFDGKLNTLQGQYKGNIDEIRRTQSIQKEVKSRMGLPEKTSYYDELSRNAENAFTDLRKGNEHADKYLEKATEMFGKNSAFEAAGINVAKIFGFSPETADKAMQIGEALYVLDQLKSGELQKEMYDGFQKEQQNMVRSTPAGGNPNLAQGSRELSAWDRERLGL